MTAMTLLLILLWIPSRSDQRNRYRLILNVSELKRRNNKDVLLNVTVFVQFILHLHLRPVCHYQMFHRCQPQKLPCFSSLGTSLTSLCSNQVVLASE